MAPSTPDHAGQPVTSRDLILGTLVLVIGGGALAWFGGRFIVATHGWLGAVLGIVYLLAGYWVVAGLVVRASGLTPGRLILAILNRIRSRGALE